MDFEKKYKLQEELNSEPKISAGDVVVCKGIRATIAQIFYADRCIEWHNEKEEFVKYYDVEFKDTNGVHRRWKSYFDGGHIEYKER